MQNLKKHNILTRIALLLVGFYRTIGTTFLGGQCRFEPSCSQYAVDALQTLPLKTSLVLITKRILKCRPGGPYGYDPVPQIEKNQKNPSHLHRCCHQGEHG